MCVEKVDLSGFSFNFKCEVCDSSNILVGLDRTPSLRNPVLILECQNKNCENKFNSIISVSEKKKELTVL